MFLWFCCCRLYSDGLELGSDLWLPAVVLWNSAPHVSTMLRSNLDLSDSVLDMLHRCWWSAGLFKLITTTSPCEVLFCPADISERYSVSITCCLPDLFTHSDCLSACPWPRLPCVYSITCLPPASTLCLLSVYDSVSLRYPWRCYQICACLTRCTSNKAVYGSQRHWLCVTNNEHQ